MNKKLLYTYLILLFSVGCSSYEKLLKSTDYEQKYKMAFEYYHKKDYSKSITLFEQIQTIYGGTSKADTVTFYLAMSYFNQEDYIMAAEQYREFTETFARSAMVEKAYYNKAYCFYKLSPRPELDQEFTKMAIVEFELFINKFPLSSSVPDCKRLMIEMRDKLVEKSYLNAKLYYRLGQYKASLIALRNSLSEYPDTKHREELKFLLVKASYLLAQKSVEEKQKERYQDSLDECFSFIDEYPDSKLKKDVDKIYQSTLKYLGNSKDTENL